MKTSGVLRGLGLVLAFILLHSALCLRVQGQAGYTVTALGPDWQVLQKTNVVNGTNRVARYTELATGMNYTNASGQLVPASEQITLLPGGGAAATHGRHQVFFPGNLYSGVLEVVTPDGKHLKSRPLGVSYDDGSNTVFIATLKSAVGYLTSSNTVTYRDAFTGFRADLVCTYRRGGFECDLVFRQQPPTPGDYGLDASYSTLQMVTEFFNTADPVQIPAGYDDNFGLQDVTLKFGKLTMTHGKAFAFKPGTNSNSSLLAPNSSAPVYKSWLHSGGRTFLIEELPVLDLADDLNALPLTARSEKAEGRTQKWETAPARGRTELATFNLQPATHRTFPAAPAPAACTNQIQLAVNDFKDEPGVVLDYHEVVDPAFYGAYEFQTNTTYFISGAVGCSLAVLDPGAILKFNEASGEIGEQVFCQTTPDHPAILTSCNDNGVGEPIAGSTGTPNFCLQAFAIGDNSIYGLDGCIIKNVVFKNFSIGVSMYYTLPADFWNVKFINCGIPMLAYGTDVNIYNSLFVNCGAVVAGAEGAKITALYTTAVNCGTITYDWDVGDSVLCLTNSLIVNCGDWGSFASYATNFTVVTDEISGLFATQPADVFYLASASPLRERGVYSFFPGVPMNIKTMTTFAPQDGGWLDTNGTDLGYHYPVEDFDHDGLPDWWEWKYFGDYHQQGTSKDYVPDGLGDYDGDGVSNLQEYLNGTDPNKIRFTLEATNDFVNRRMVSLAAVMEGGVPSYYTAFVKGSATTNWLPFTSTNFIVSLGATDGVYDVVVGLKGRPADATQTWENYQFILDRVAPLVGITNPVIVNGISRVIKPYLALQGFANEQLVSLTYNISNSAGVFSNQDVFVNGQFFDTNRLEYTTNWFHAWDVPLALSNNAITLRVKDRAGNTTTTNFKVVLDYTSATNPPVVKLLWPQDGMAVFGTNLTLRGTTSDETGYVVANVVHGDGTTNTVYGTVERNGMFWLEHVPLNGINQITVQATDAAGNVTATNFTVNPSRRLLTIDYTPTGDALYDATGQCGGRVDASNAVVRVNGVLAEVESAPNAEGSYYWNAVGVPVVGQGTATFDAQATRSDPAASFAGSGIISNAISIAIEMGAYILATEHHCVTSYKDKNFDANGDLLSLGFGSSSRHYTATVANVSGYLSHAYHGSLTSSRTDAGNGQIHLNVDDYDWTALAIHHGWWYDGEAGETNEYIPTIRYPRFGDRYELITGVPGRDVSAGAWVDYPPLCVMHYYANRVQHSWHWGFPDGSSHDAEVGVGAGTIETLFTGGKSGGKRKHLYTIKADATEYGKSKAGGWANTPMRAVPSTDIRVLGKDCDPNGEVRESLSDNDAVGINLFCRGHTHYGAGTAIKSIGCIPVRLNFSDEAKTDPLDYPRHFWVELQAVCSQNWDTNTIHVLDIIGWGFDVDSNGAVTLRDPITNGIIGQCSKIFVDKNVSNNGSAAKSAYVRLEAHYVGCCDGTLNWRQRIITDNRAVNNLQPPCYDGNPTNSYYPFVYGPPGCLGPDGYPSPIWEIDSIFNTQAYPDDGSWPATCH
jgi:hypothetical protein